jgi:lipoprotein-anchoring transpeptidase ErfK/SrfK
MDIQNTKAHELIVKARDALHRGDKESALKLGEQAALLAPDMEDAWLILAASEPNPQEALVYAQQALEINPLSTRARKGVEWAVGQLKQAQAASPSGDAVSKSAREPSLSPVMTELGQENPQPGRKSNNRKLIYAASFLGLLICVVVVFSAYTAVTHPAFASILSSVPVPTHEDLWAPVEIAKPTLITPIEVSAFAQDVADTPTAKPTRKPSTSVPTATPTSPPTGFPTEATTSTPEVTETPGSMVMEIVEDTPTSEYVAPSSSAPLPDIARSGNGARWIDVDLTNQHVYAYEGDVVVNSFIVSTGTWLTPTVTGQYKIYVKYRSAKMSGPGYYLPNVPYIMYFYKGYGLHGTYWHNNFGTPMSHGCVNLRTDDAAWLYDWASVGTLVNVHH